MTAQRDDHELRGPSSVLRGARAGGAAQPSRALCHRRGARRHGPRRTRRAVRTRDAGLPADGLYDHWRHVGRSACWSREARIFPNGSSLSLRTECLGTDEAGTAGFNGKVRSRRRTQNGLGRGRVTS